MQLTRIPNRVTHSFIIGLAPNICCLPRVWLFTSGRPQFGRNAIVKEVSNAKVTTQKVANILGIHISDLRRMMRQGEIVPPPILFDATTNSVGRMWSEDDIEVVPDSLENCKR